MRTKDLTGQDIQSAQAGGRSFTRRAGRIAAALGFALALTVLGVQPGQARGIGPQSVADLAENLIDAVVNISTTQKAKGHKGVPRPKLPKGSPFEKFFDEFFKNENNQRRKRRKVRSLGSGFVIDPSGIVITNNHVIKNADEITINFNDGTKLKATIIGRDPKIDIAVLKVETKKPLKAVKFGDSSKARVGDWVLAIGNPFGLGGTVTVGIVSARNRNINSGPYDDYIQTDAAINKGNSGGPLFNMEGDVIGINTAIISPSGGSIGIGFSVPSDTASPVIQQLREYGETRRGWLGVRIQTVTDEIAESLGLKKAHGALVGGVNPDGPAAKGGVTVGDVILKFDGKIVPNMRDLPRMVAKTDIGKAVEVEVLRRGKRKLLSIMLGRLEDGEKRAEKSKTKKDGKAEPEKSIVSLGMTLSAISDDLRATHALAGKVKGVLITAVDPDSTAADKGVAKGQVIVEANQEQVSKPEEFVKKIEALRKMGRSSVLLLLSDKKGDLRFIAVRISKAKK